MKSAMAGRSDVKGQDPTRNLGHRDWHASRERDIQIIETMSSNGAQDSVLQSAMARRCFAKAQIQHECWATVTGTLLGERDIQFIETMF